jgi:hypothetical protein
MPHVPAVQAGVPLVTVQAVAQLPQWLTSVAAALSQPSLAIALQLSKPALHAPRTHALPEQLAPALANVHALPHAPQFAVLVAVSTSQPSPGTPLQSRVVPGQVFTTHMLFTQTAPATHALPQEPQLALSFVVLISQPSLAPPLQLANPVLLVPSEHVLDEHTPVALA